MTPILGRRDNLLERALKLFAAVGCLDFARGFADALRAFFVGQWWCRFFGHGLFLQPRQF
jgi:hypothetical protein